MTSWLFPKLKIAIEREEIALILNCPYPANVEKMNS
jgi:hypothetical protein